MERLQQINNQLSNEKTQVEFEDDGRIGIIYLNAPKELNALSQKMKQEIADNLKSLDKNDKVKVEKAFCAGANIVEFPSLTFENQITHDIFKDFDLAISNVSKPVIAGVNGVAFGGGCELAMSADIIVCSENAQFGQPEIKLGLIPGLGGTQRLTKLVGRINAQKMVLSGEPITSKDAHRMGLVSDIFPKENFHNSVINFAKKFSDKPRTTLIIAKKAVNQAEEVGITEGLKYERSLFLPLYNTQAAKEGIAAFRNKQKPNFKDL